MEDNNFSTQLSSIEEKGVVKQNYYHSFIYLTTNLVNGLIYIGQHKSAYSDLQNDSYIGSGVKFLEAVTEFGKESFSFEILQHCSRKDLNNREKFWIKFYQANNPGIGYNLTSGGSSDYEYTDEVRKKISEATKLAMSRTEVKERIARTKSLPENKEKSLISNREAQNRPEVNLRRGKSVSEARNRPEFKSRMLEYNARPEVKARRSQISIEVNNRPGVKEKRKETCSKPEVKQKRIETLIKTFSSPEYKIRRAEVEAKPEVKERHRIAGVATNARPEVKLKISNNSQKYFYVQFSKEGEFLQIFENTLKIKEQIPKVIPADFVDKDLYPKSNSYGFKWKKFLKSEITLEKIKELYNIV